MSDVDLQHLSIADLQGPTKTPSSSTQSSSTSTANTTPTLSTPLPPIFSLTAPTNNPQQHPYSASNFSAQNRIVAGTQSPYAASASPSNTNNNGNNSRPMMSAPSISVNAHSTIKPSPTLPPPTFTLTVPQKQPAAKVIKKKSAYGSDSSSDEDSDDADSESDNDKKSNKPVAGGAQLMESSAPSDPAALAYGDVTGEQIPAFPAVNGPQRLAACSTDPKSKRRIKFALAPGHSPLDWARLTGSGADLRGVPMMAKYTLQDLKLHNKAEDAWTALNGKVYNITPYLPFHPGGEKELLRCAGRDGTKLFNLTHKWVNYEFMLKECQVGFLVAEASSHRLTAI